jgi:glycosyltransferase involved in cell wall biosynthesis
MTIAEAGADVSQDTAQTRFRVTLVLFDLSFRGGIVRTITNLAGELAKHHDVEILSVQRKREEPGYPVPPGVSVRYLEDGHRAAGRTGPVDRLRSALSKRPSRLVHPNDETYPKASLWTDLVLTRALRSLPPGVIVTTRPSLHMIAARFAANRVVTIGAEHINFRTRDKQMKRAFVEVAEGLDAITTLTEPDKHDFERLFAGKPTLIEAIPNALSWPRGEPSPLANNIVIAAGRLARQKGFDLLIEAYAPVARAHPDWQLHIYGGRTGAGIQEALTRQIEDLGLVDQVFLKGRTEHMAEAMHGASIFALSSRWEGFPMVLLEAMAMGLPVVSFDCPRGPREVVVSGTNGYLVDNGDVEGFGKSLAALIEDDDGRERMGKGAFASAGAYELTAISARWEELFGRLLRDPRHTRRERLVLRAARRRLPGRAVRSSGSQRRSA